MRKYSGNATEENRLGSILINPGVSGNRVLCPLKELLNFDRIIRDQEVLVTYSLQRVVEHSSVMHSTGDTI